VLGIFATAFIYGLIREFRRHVRAATPDYVCGGGISNSIDVHTYILCRK
jgi:hypothetical protein